MLNIIIKKQDILPSLALVQSIVDKKTVMSIINNILLYTEDDNLYIEATDLEISYRTKIPCTIEEEGSITINAKKLYEIIKDFPYEEIYMQELENIWINIWHGENVQYKMAGLPIEDFPRFKNISMDNYIELDADTFKNMIDKTIFATSLDEGKLNLTGILFEYKDNDGDKNIKLVGSDGNHLSVIEKEINKGLNQDIEFIIPRKGAQEIRKLIENRDQIIFGKYERFCYVITDDNKMIVRLLDTKYPNYKKIIPDVKVRSLILNRLDVLNSVRRISILSLDTDFKSIAINISDNLMQIESMDKEIGEAKELINIDYQGDPFSFTINARYLIKLLSIMKSENIEFTYNDENKPCVLTGEDDKGYLALIMPLINY